MTGASGHRSPAEPAAPLARRESSTMDLSFRRSTSRDDEQSHSPRPTGKQGRSSGRQAPARTTKRRGTASAPVLSERDTKPEKVSFAAFLAALVAFLATWRPLLKDKASAALLAALDAVAGRAKAYRAAPNGKLLIPHRQGAVVGLRLLNKEAQGFHWETGEVHTKPTSAAGFFAEEIDVLTDHYLYGTDPNYCGPLKLGQKEEPNVGAVICALIQVSAMIARQEKTPDSRLEADEHLDDLAYLRLIVGEGGQPGTTVPLTKVGPSVKAPSTTERMPSKVHLELASKTSQLFWNHGEATEQVSLLRSLLRDDDLDLEELRAVVDEASESLSDMRYALFDITSHLTGSSTRTMTAISATNHLRNLLEACRHTYDPSSSWYQALRADACRAFESKKEQG